MEGEMEEFKMSGNRYTEKELIDNYKEMIEFYGKQPSQSEITSYKEINNGTPSFRTFKARFGSFERLNDICNIETIYEGQGYAKSFLVNELKRFYREKGKLPTSSELESKECNYPSRKTYEKYFTSIEIALLDAGFSKSEIINLGRLKPLPQGIVEFNKQNLKELFFKYIDEYGEIPTLKQLEDTEGYPTRNDYRKIFGNFSNAMLEFGFEPRKKEYTTDELRDAFMLFVERNGRIPSHLEFNNSEYPSFWCYQNRFGSWNKAVEAYGFTPTNEGTGFNYTFDDGEIVKSSYEFDVSTFFRKNSIKYERNVPYKNHIESYIGRRDCDYVLNFKGELLFIEVAGFYTFNDNESSIEKDYIRRFDAKIEIIESANLNYFVIYPKDFKEKSLDEIFSFLYK
jgi:hypothetical protein